MPRPVWAGAEHTLSNVGLVRDRRRNTCTVLLGVRGNSFSLTETSDQHNRLDDWGQILAQFGREASPVVRLGWTLWSAPDEPGISDGHLTWLADHRDDSPELRDVEANYRELLAATTVYQHELRVWITVSAGPPDPARAQTWIDGALAMAKLLSERCAAAGLVVSAPMSPVQITQAMRVQADPTIRAALISAHPGLPERTGLEDTLPTPDPDSSGFSHLVDPVYFAPLAVQSRWDAVAVDGAWHRAFWVSHWPDQVTDPAWLQQLLINPPGVRTLAVSYEPVSARASRRKITAEAVSVDSQLQLRERHDVRVPVDLRRAHQDIDQREAELGAGHTEVAILALVVLSDISLTDLDDASQAFLDQAARAGITDLRPLHARHEAAWACTLPLGRVPDRELLHGMPPMTPSADRRPHEGPFARQGVTLPRQLMTTAHASALYPFSIEAGLGTHGAFLGRDHGSGGGFYFDLHAAYDAGLIQGPNAIVSGAGAHGKSAILKTLVYRSSLLRTAGRQRFTAVIDPKGEWVPLARALGWSVLQLRPGGTERVNPLDVAPGLLTSTTSARVPDLDDVVAQRVAVSVTLLAQALDQTQLTATEHRLVHAAMTHLTHYPPLSTRPNPASGSLTPTLNDLRALLANPTAALAADLDTTLPELLDRRRLLLDACAVLLEHDLRGICDGATTVILDWATAPGVVLDLSALLSRRRALRMVLTAAAGWLAGVMYSQPARHKMNIIDEGWAALDDLAVVRYLQDQWRLGRQWGVANVLIIHALADLKSQTDDGTAQTKITQGLLNTTSVRIFLHQNPEHVLSLLTDMGLNTTQAGLLDRLAPFQALWQIGAHTTLVEHVISATEWAFADTDTAMRGSADNLRPRFA